MKGSSQSIYEEESNNTKQLQEKTEKVIRFLWDGNTLLHEWEEDNTVNRIKPKSKVDYKADFVLKLEKQEEEKARQEAERGQRPPDSLITWIFQDDFIPRGKITKDGNYSIISDHLGTPVEAYDEEGNKVWERELDIYGRVKTGRKDIYGRTEKEIGEKNFIPFRFQGQYEDEEIGLYYNRFQMCRKPLFSVASPIFCCCRLYQLSDFHFCVPLQIGKAVLLRIGFKNTLLV